VQKSERFECRRIEAEDGEVESRGRRRRRRVDEETGQEEEKEGAQ
jgi:hypothetical protein